MAEGCRGRAFGGNSGRDSEERTFLAGPHAFASTPSRQRRRNSLAQRVSAGKGSCWTGSPGGATSNQIGVGCWPSGGSVTPTIAFTLTGAVFQPCLEPRPRTSARRPCAGHPLRRVLQIEIANQPVQIIRMHAQTLRGLRATALRFLQSTLNQALLQILYC